MFAPASLDLRGDLVQQRSSLSMAHGPAIIARWPAADLAPRRPRTTESSAWNSRLASLNGFRIGTTCSTPGIACSGSACSFSSSPITPMIVRDTPWLRWGDEAQLLDPLDDVLDHARASDAASRR